MYYRSQGYHYPRNMRIPSNYGGSVFQADDTDDTDEESNATNDENIYADVNSNDALTEVTSDTAEAQNESETPASILSGFSSGSLFGGKIGNEELLILALILLLSDSNGNSDIVWLLLILLFVK